LTVLAGLALLPVLADLWGSTFTELAARMEHGLVLAVVWPWEQVRGALHPDSSDSAMWFVVLVNCGVVALALTGIAALIDPRPGERPSWLRRLVAAPWVLAVGVPALLVTLALVFLGLALDPMLMGSLVAFGALGGLLGRRRRRALLPWERSLSGLLPAYWKTDHLVRFFLLLVPLALAYTVASILTWRLEGRPLQHALALDGGTGLTGPAVLPWVFGLLVVLGLLLTPTTRRALGLMTWEPWVAAAIGGVVAGLVLGLVRGPEAGQAAMPLGCALGFLGTLMAGAGIPWFPRLSPHPLRAVGRLGLPLAASMAVVAHVASTGFFGCDAVVADPRIERITRQPAAIGLALAGTEPEGLFIAFGAERHLVRLALDGSSTYVLESDKLQLDTDERPLVEPVLLGEGPGGRRYVVVRVEENRGPKEGLVTTTAVVELDPWTARPVAIDHSLEPCTPASWGWNPLLSLGVVGCADAGAVLLWEPTMQRLIAREELRGLPEFTSLAIDPADGTMLALAKRHSPFLVRLDLEERRPVDWQFLGMSNRTLDLDDLGILRVARFVGRGVLTFDLGSLEPADSRPAGFALGPLSDAPMHDRVVAASLLDGHLYAVDTVGRRPTERLHVGGAVRSLALGPDERTLFTAGMCGVLEVDLDGWLGR